MLALYSRISEMAMIMQKFAKAYLGKGGISIRLYDCLVTGQHITTVAQSNGILICKTHQ